MDPWTVLVGWYLFLAVLGVSGGSPCTPDANGTLEPGCVDMRPSTTAEPPRPAESDTPSASSQNFGRR